MIDESLLEPFFEIVLSESIGDYQGDTLLVLRNKSDYGWRWTDSESKVWGFLVTGYGSCSGCDVWEGAETGTQKFALLAEEIEGIRWFQTLPQLQAYVTDKYTTELEWWGNEPDYKAFAKTVSELTGGETDG
jgi:hypothetical protein